MKHSYIEIENFKGIRNLRFAFDRKPSAPVYTLVGLNESGKTTLLEAIYFHEVKTQSTGRASLHSNIIGDLRQLVPISEFFNFNGRIRIECGYVLDEQDKSKVYDYLVDTLRFKPIGDIPELLQIELIYEFKDSLVVDSNPDPEYYFDLQGTSGKSKKIKEIEGDQWSQLAVFLDKLRPSVVYFPNFLFEFPDRIYLNNPPKNETQKHRVYGDVLQDVLHAVNSGMTLETHVIKRITGDVSPLDEWLTASLDSLLSKMESHISATVFPKWNRIFTKKITAKEIKFKHGLEKFPDNEQPSAFLEVRLREGTNNYAISQRSLGFRWFFSFLLFTIYRGFRGSNKNTNVLFLFDEPASNLHSSAQTELLGSFSELGENSVVLYTTHSQYLINPNWLETVYVVKNEAIKYDEDEDTFNSEDTEISLTRYRDFVTTHPEQTRYFQPILEVLDFYPSQLENVPDVVMLEGKNDFYTLKYAHDILLERGRTINLMPGGGAGTLDNSIRLYIAWGRNFIVILDSDKGGRTQKERYLDLFGPIVGDRIFTLKDIDGAWEKTSTEGLFTLTEQVRIQKTASYDSQKFNKTHFNRAIQEHYLKRTDVPVCGSTKKNFQKIFDFADRKLVREPTTARQ